MKKSAERDYKKYVKENQEAFTWIFKHLKSGNV